MRTYGLIGKSLGHSFSAGFFKDFFEKNGVDAEYRNFELPEIQEISRFFDLHPSGLNVTIPYKESVIPFLDELSGEALVIGAVNCIQFLDGKKIGHNTDAYGFQQSVKPFLTFYHERALVFGTGGASKAIAYALKTLGVDCLFVIRNKADIGNMSLT